MQFLLMLSVVATAAPLMAATSPLPDMLLWKGKPIEPYCFNELIPQEKPDGPITLNLDKCLRPANVEIVPANPDDAPQEKPYDYGYDYKEKSPDETDPATQTIGYRFNGVSGDQAVVTVFESGGGSGQFDSTLLLKRDGAKLVVAKDLAEGDRCTGGVSKVVVKDGKITIDQYITSGGLIELSGYNPHHINEEGNDLDSSAAGCIGVKCVSDGKFVAFVPNADTIHYTPEADEPSIKYQTCFNKLMGGIPNTNPWTMAQIKEFSHHFNRACVEKKGS